MFVNKRSGFRAYTQQVIDSLDIMSIPADQESYSERVARIASVQGVA